VVKNKVAPPFKQAEFDILYDEGISMEGELIDIGVEEGFVQKAGAWYSYGEDRIGQGKDNSREWLKEHRKVADELEIKIREVKGILPGKNAADDAPMEEEPVSA
jgi:recombination protein RecA